MTLADVVEHIRLLPEAYVDYGFRQGRDAVLKQLNERTGENQEAFVDRDIEDMQNTIAELSQRFAAFDIPNDYISFLEYYGGLSIDSEATHFSVLGAGPMVEDWYGSIVSDYVYWELEPYGILTLGSVSFRRHHKHEFQRLSFFLDLAGIVQKQCVISIGPWGQGTLTPLDILKNVRSIPDKWKKVANSFTEWLKLAAETHGTFGYA